MFAIDRFCKSDLLFPENTARMVAGPDWAVRTDWVRKFRRRNKKTLGIPGLFITKIVVRDLGLLLATEATCCCTDSKQTENRDRGRLGDIARQPNIVDQATIVRA